MKKIRYDSAMGALFTESARGLNVKQQTTLMSDLRRAFNELDKAGVKVDGKRIGNVTLSIDWFQKAENQADLVARLHGESRQYVQSALTRLEGARVRYDEDRGANMITMPIADGQR